MIAAMMIVMVMLPTMHTHLTDIRAYSEGHIGRQWTQAREERCGCGGVSGKKGDGIKYNNLLLWLPWRHLVSEAGWSGGRGVTKVMCTACKCEAEGCLQ